MEQTQLPRKNKARYLLKKCFKNPLFSLVPFEIWRDIIVSNAELKTIVVLSQTCFAFKELVDNIGESNFNLALMFRKECRIRFARKFLLKCARSGNALAMFHLGYAFWGSGWGLSVDDVRAAEWFKKSAEAGNEAGMAMYARCLVQGVGTQRDLTLSDTWAKKALESKNCFFAQAHCHHRGLGLDFSNNEKAFILYEVAAKEGDEFGQFWTGEHLQTQGKYEEARIWFSKAAERGNVDAQLDLGVLFQYRLNDAKDNLKIAISWYKKAAKQGNLKAKRCLQRIAESKTAKKKY